MSFTLDAHGGETVASSPCLVQIKYYTIQVGFTLFRIDVRYQNLTFIGEGSFGCVVSALDTTYSRMVAIKKIREPLLQRDTMKRVIRELKISTHCTGHENIVSVYDVMVDPPDVPEFEDLYIVTSLFEASLGSVIRSNQNLTEQHYQYFLYQTLRGLKYMHSADIVHRDLKPSNLLVNSSCDLALCDFGSGRSTSYSTEDPLTRNVVDLFYRAPELLCDNSSYGKSVDIWSVGCIFAELITRVPFFKGENPSHQLKVILSKIDSPSNKERLKFIKNKNALNIVLSHNSDVSSVPHFGFNFPDGASYLILDLLKKMLQFCPEDRITADNALKHPFLQQLHTQNPDRNCSVIFNYSFQLPFQSKNADGRFNTELDQTTLASSVRSKSTSSSSSGSGSSNNSGSSASTDSCYMDQDDLADNVQNAEEIARKNFVIDQMLRKETRLVVIHEVMKYRPVSQQMIAFVTYASDKYV